MNSIKLWIYVVVYQTLLISGNIYAQTPAEYGFQPVDNTPSEQVYDILPDRKGFVWIGHELGISRYDGISFTSYYHPKQSLLGTANLIEDRQGRIWCRNFNGQVFYIDRERMKLLETDIPNLWLSPFVVMGDTLFASSNKGFFIYDINRRRYRIINTTPEVIWTSSGIYRDIFTDGKSVFILIATDNKKYVLKYQNGKLKRFRNSVNSDYNAIINANETAILLKGEIPSSYFSHFNIQGDELIHAGINYLGDSTPFLRASRNGDHIWIHTWKQSFRSDSTDTIRNLILRDIITDEEGNTWGASSIHGLLLKKRKPEWELYTAFAEKGKRISHLDTFGGKIIAATIHGELLISDTSGFKPELTIPLTKTITGGFLSGDYLLIYGQNYIAVLNKQFRIVRYIPVGGNLLDACRVDGYSVFATHQGMIAMGHHILPPDSSNTQPPPDIIQSHFSYDNMNGTYQHIQGKRIRTLCYLESQKTLYAGISNGLYVYTGDMTDEILFNNAPIHAYSLIRYKDKVYAGTLNNGILVLKNGKVIRQLDTKEGLLSASVLKLKKSGSHLWILGQKDIQLYDMEQGRFVSIHTLPPVKGTQVYDLLELQDKLYISTVKGIYITRINTSGKESPLPRQYLLSVIVNSSDTIYNNASLPWQKNSLQFNLAGLYYYDAGRVFFRYRLLSGSADTNWKVNPPGQNTISFSYLPPGKYRLEAVAQTSTGLMATNKITFSFIINKPWWFQLWFIISVITALSLLIIIIIRNRIRNRKKAHRRIIEKLQYEKALNESELKALKSQMNPHFIFNSLNTIQEMFMWGNKNDANEQLSNFATLTRLILNVSGKKSIPLSTETDILKKYLELEKMRFQENFSYEIIMDEEVDEGYIHIPPMIIQPFVENSIKHGLLHKEGEKKLSIIFQLIPGDEYIACIIRDNGIGRKKAAEIREAANYNYNSFSTEATKKRLQLISKNINDQILVTYTDLKDETGAATGTSVRIMIPTFV